jgi:NADH-quinone oxidoreductase subunit L
MPLYLIILFPLLGFVIDGLLGAKLKKPIPGAIASLAVLASFAVAAFNFFQLANLTPEAHQSALRETLYTWMSVGKFSVDVSLLLDQLSGVMILVITGIGFLIHVYSVGYMNDDHNDPDGKLNARYFAWLNLFVAFMSLLVLADNYLLMFVGWEGVGLCSYFLVGYWFKREDAAQASKKAFIVNRIGDCGFLLAMTLIFLAAGSLQYEKVFEVAHNNPVAFNTGVLASLGGVTLIALLIFVGACGKSAQIPLHTWLPDAMAGPTPVSALIHAATMVTAGVYICARSSAIFEMPDAAPAKMVIVVIGCATALFAGLTALAHTDIKKVLAYSTVSQLGFMFMAIGAGAYAVAIFHVFTHAFFKACLFLGAGSVIHALHGEQDMNKMGGLSQKMKATNITFLLSGLALAGAAPFAGFFSKDEIIAEVFKAGGNEPLYMVCGILALITAFITALYTGRQYAQVFLGTPRDEHLFEHAHESPTTMTVPLWILAIGAVFAGFLGVPHIPGVPEQLHAFSNWLSPLFASEAGAEAAAHGGEHSVNWILLGIGVLIGWSGWFAGVTLGKNAARAALPESTRALSLDAIYSMTIVRGGEALAAALKWIDDNIIDGIVNGVGGLVGQVSETIRYVQTSYVRTYAFTMAIGAIFVVAYFLMQRGP